VSALDRDLLAERLLVVERHLQRVADRLPQSAADLLPSSDASDAVVLHLWQATQIVIDLATAACVKWSLGTPATYSDAFSRLENAGIVEPLLARRLKRAAGFRNVIAHAYERLDMARVHAAATDGPADLRALMAAIGDRLR
jgi:uncharacterized protein YutE (UPF0331/DUF86 family)